MKEISEIVDDALSWMKSEFFPMTCVEGAVPVEMIDARMDAEEDYVGWKAIPSDISDLDILGFEQKINCKLPDSYISFLQHKYFYQLYLQDSAIRLHNILPGTKMKRIEELIFDYHNPEKLIGRGYVYFADFRDIGLLTFDTNSPVENNEFKVVYFDHDELETKYTYANSFTELMNFDKNRSNSFIENVLNKRFE